MLCWGLSTRVKSCGSNVLFLMGTTVRSFRRLMQTTWPIRKPSPHISLLEDKWNPACVLCIFPYVIYDIVDQKAAWAKISVYEIELPSCIGCTKMFHLLFQAGRLYAIYPCYQRTGGRSKKLTKRNGITTMKKSFTGFWLVVQRLSTSLCHISLFFQFWNWW